MWVFYFVTEVTTEIGCVFCVNRHFKMKHKRAFMALLKLKAAAASNKFMTSPATPLRKLRDKR